MADIEVAESSDGVIHRFTIYQKDSNVAENLTGYTTATMTIKSLDLTSTIATLTISITDAANGIITYTTSVSHALPAITIPDLYKDYTAIIKITGSSLKDITNIFSFRINNDLTA